MDLPYLGESYETARFVFQRGLGIVYLIAFTVARNQFQPLLGEDGIQPVPRFLQRVSFRRMPSLFHWRFSDALVSRVAWTGIGLSLVAATGLSDLGPLWLSILVWFALWALYLSIVNVGQTFYGFGWESMLLEAGFLAIFLGPASVAAPVLMIFLIRWMLFRVEFGAGLIKIRGDPCWRDLTCLEYHHETQPMPNPFSWYAHRMPRWWHRVETAGNHAVQLGVIWLIFFPQPVASIAGAVIILSQLWLVLSGNFSWLNWLTIILGLSTFSDGVIQRVAGGALGVDASLVGLQLPYAWYALTMLVVAVTGLVIWLSINPVKNLLSRGQLMNASFNPLHLVNTYGAFGHVTKQRYEIVLQGTNDDPDDANATWHTYRFKGKPTDPSARPPQWAPYHLRLDWQMWFAAMTPYHANPWFIVFVKKLLDGQPDVLKLLHHDPFGGDPPRYLRALWYHYRFTTPEEKRETGQWWKRRYVSEYLPVVSRRDLARALPPEPVVAM